MKLTHALEAVVKKLLDKPSTYTPEILASAGDALGLIAELCAARQEPELTTPPPRLLVVDDDPLARRAICNSIQLLFERPEQAENGEVAVEKAAGQPFDLIFMDVLMPGMDGYASCSKIPSRR